MYIRSNKVIFVDFMIKKFIFIYIHWFLAIWFVEQLVSFPMNFLIKSTLSANMAGF